MVLKKRLPILKASRKNIFLWVGLVIPRPTPNPQPGEWFITFDPSGMGGPNSSYVTASITLRIA
jgi:hypothetical protein